MTLVGLAVTVIGILVWLYVALKAVRTRQEFVVLALILIILGILGAQIFAFMGFDSPGSWSFLAAGILLLCLWPGASDNS